MPASLTGLLFLRGVAMGLALAIPVGPICILCIRRALANGTLPAFLSTLGAAVADGILGACFGLGSSVVADFFEREQQTLRIVGGLFLVYLAARSFWAGVSLEPEPAGGVGLARQFVSSLLLTLFNPANILGVMGVFAAVGSSEAGDLRRLGLLLAGVLGGSALWWLALSTAAGLVRRHFSPRVVVWMSRGSAVILGIFGLAILGSALLGHPA